jgi:hypothetical protein
MRAYQHPEPILRRVPRLLDTRLDIPASTWAFLAEVAWSQEVVDQARIRYKMRNNQDALLKVIFFVATSVWLLGVR